MNDQEMKQKLALYLEATEKLNVQSSSDNAIDVDEQKKLFHSVISDMGVSAKEYEELEKVGQQFFTLAKEAHQAGNHKQSVHFCEKSLEIMPFEIEILELLMNAHLQLSRPKDAQNVAKSILRMQPSNKEALRIAHQLSANTSENTIWIILTGVFLLLIGLCLVVLNINSEKDEVVDPPVATPEKTIESQKSSTEEVRNTQSNTPDMVVTTDNLPVEIFGIPEAITFENRNSELSKYQDSFSFHLRLALKNMGKNEIGKMEAKLILFDDKGGVVEDEMFEAKGDYTPVIRPGETFGLEKLIYKKMEILPNITKAHLVLHTIKQTPAPKKISKDPVELGWKSPKPDQFSLKVERRLSDDSLGSESIISEFYARNIYEVTNTGTGVIELLQLQDDFYDEKGNHIGSGQGYVTIRSYPYIAPNETRVISIGSDLPQIATSVQVTVVEIK